MSNNIQVGDYVRSFDFPGIRDDCYLEGLVVGIGDVFKQPPDHYAEFDCPRYHIRVDRVVLEGKKSTWVGKYAFPPVNGTPGVFGLCNGVVKIDPPKA